MTELVESLEQKVPQISEQRRVYEELQDENRKLQARLEDASAARRVFEASARAREREAQSARATADDLSRQVMALTAEVARLKGSRARLPPCDRLSGNGALTASEVIAERLVEFEDVEALHRRNVELLALVRRLSEDNERTRAEVEAQLREDFAARERRLEEEVQGMREDREREKELVAQVARQRDLFKALAARVARGESVDAGTFSLVQALGSPGGVGKGAAAGALGSGSAGANADGVDWRALLADKEREFAELRTEAARNAELLRKDVEVRAVVG